MRIELVVIGLACDEAGRLAAWLERELLRSGLCLDRFTAVGAGAGAPAVLLSESAARADVVVAAADTPLPPNLDPARLFQAPLSLAGFRERCEGELLAFLADTSHTDALERRGAVGAEGAELAAQHPPDPPEQPEDATHEALASVEDHVRTESLAERIGALCRARSASLAVAESCTGGLLGATLTAVPGSSAYFLGGAVTYSNAEKTRALDVPAALIERHGAVSAEVARAMASGLRRLTGASHVLSVTGVAGPDGGSPQKPVGTVWIGLSTPSRTRAEAFWFAGGRAEVRTAAVTAALDLLRRELEAEP